jgi:hypothetical protein
MPANLRLIPFPLPQLPAGRIHACLTDPRRQWLGLVMDEGLVVLGGAAGLAQPVSFPLPAQANRTRNETVRLSLFSQIASLSLKRPAEAPQLALHPSGQLAAHVSHEKIQLIEPGPASARSVFAFSDAEAAEVKGAAFSASGEVLWVSREFGDAAGRAGQPDPWHEVLAFATDDYRLLGRAAVQGEQQGGHTLTAHPAEEIVGVEVSCGQDGSWITFASVQDGRVTRLAQSVSGDSDPFSFAGFAPDGKTLATIGATVIEEFSWPGCQSMARIDGEAEAGEEEGGGLFFNWNGAYAGANFFALAEGEEGDVLCAFACPGLRRITAVNIAGGTNELSGRLMGFGDNLLIEQLAAGVRAWQVSGP